MLELEKEDIKEHIDTTLKELSKVIEKDRQLELGFSEDVKEYNNPKLKGLLLNIINYVKELKNKDKHFYNEILSEIPILEAFNDEIKDLNKLITYCSKNINSINNSENINNINKFISSPEIFYFINKKNDFKKLELELEQYGGFGFIGDYLGSIWKQTKQEELLGLILYINSGKATKDYVDFLNLQTNTTEDKDNFLYKRFKESFQDLVVKETKDGEMVVENRKKDENRKGVAPANYLDHGVIIDKDKKEIFIGFATSEYQTQSQQKQFFKKRKILKENFKNESAFKDYKVNIVYITNGLINENIILGGKEHQKPLLNSFNEKLTLKEKNLINTASILSIMGNLTFNDRLSGLKIEDFLDVNPFVSGSDTTWIKDAFKKIKNKDDMLMFRGFLIDSAKDLLDIFDKLPNGNKKMLDAHAKILSHCENIFKASIEGFSNQITKTDMLNKGFIKKVVAFSNKYEEIHLNKFMGTMPNNNEILANNLYDTFSDEKRTFEYLEKNYTRVCALEKSLSSAETKLKIIDKDNSYQINNINKVVKTLSALPLLAIENERMISVISDMIKLKDKYPNREVKVLLRSDEACKESHNFMKAFRKWENDKNNPKTIISNLLFENINDLNNLNKELLKFKKEIKLNEFKNLGKISNNDSLIIKKQNRLKC